MYNKTELFYYGTVITDLYNVPSTLLLLTHGMVDFYGKNFIWWEGGEKDV